MKKQWLESSAVLALAISFVHGQLSSASAQEPEKLTEMRETVAALEGDLDRPFHQFNELYRKQLDALEKSATESANLDLVIAVRKERENIAGGTTLPSASPELKRIQDIYAAKVAELATERRKKYLDLLKGYHTNLTKLQAELTKANQIDDALAVREEIQLTEAKAANLPGPKVASTPESAPGTEPAPASPSPPQIDPGDGGAGDAFEKGEMVATDTVLPVRSYRIDKVTIGNREAKTKAHLTIQPGTELEGKKLWVDSERITATGAKFKGVEIQVNLNSSINFTNCLLQECNFTKGGGWFVDAWSAHFIFDNCAFSGSFFSGISTTDHGIKATNCTFYDVEFASIGYKRDAATESADQWRTIENCRFVECKIPESFLIATKNCVFENCKLVAEEITKLDSPVEATIYIEGSEPKLPGANRQVTYRIERASSLAGTAGMAYPHQFRSNQLRFE